MLRSTKVSTGRIPAASDADGFPDQDPVRLSAVLEGFTQAALKSPDPLVREAYIESVVEVLKPCGDELDSGRVSRASAR